MKVYFHLNQESFANCYLVVNEAARQALIIDPCKITPVLLEQIESGGYTLTAALLTHNHPGHRRGLAAVRRIYSPRVYAADADAAGKDTIVLQRSGEFREAGFTIAYAVLSGHSPDSVCYNIGGVYFTGDALTAGLTGAADSAYAERALAANIREKIFSGAGWAAIMPGHGPPSTVEAETRFNAAAACAALTPFPAR